MRTIKEWSIRELKNGEFSVVFNPEGLIGSGKQALAEPNEIYRGRNFEEALAAVQASGQAAL